jgi:hypothetical protein
MDLKHETPKDAMGGHEPPAPRPVIPPGTVAYEKQDVNTRSILRVAIVLGVMTTAAAGAAFGLFRLLVAHEAKGDPPPPPLGRPLEGRLAPEPRLQTAPAADLAVVREEERRLLGSYGWADEATGVARIPIEEAMALYVGQARPAPAASPAASPAPSPSPAAPSPIPSAGAHR